MMRPLAGQRNERLLLPARTELVAGGGSDGVATLAVSVGWALASCGPFAGAFGSAAVLVSAALLLGALSAFGWAASFCSGSCARAAARLAGMVMRSPMLSLACGWMLLSRASSVTGILYLREIA